MHVMQETFGKWEALAIHKAGHALPECTVVQYLLVAKRHFVHHGIFSELAFLLTNSKIPKTFNFQPDRH
jgi:hypothetical protein